MAKSWVPDASYAPIDRGYFVKKPHFSPDSGGRIVNGANAFFKAGNDMVGMFIDDVTIDFELGGTTAQGPTLRNFYPHNFMAPSFQFHGQTPNSYEYNRLANFVRQTQIDMAVRGHTGALALNLYVVMPRRIQAVQRRSNGFASMRGRHRNIHIEGYIKSMAKGAERFKNAPEYQFEFIPTLVHQLLGLEQDTKVSHQLRSFMGIINDNKQDYLPPVKKDPVPTGDDTPPPKPNPTILTGHQQQTV